MLELILISKVRVKLLTQFLIGPQDEYHVRGLVREIEEEINAVRRELSNLQHFGLLIPQKKGNKLFYKLDKTNLFYNDLRNMVFKNDKEVKAIHHYVSMIEGVRIAILTSSYIKKQYTTKDDIDLFLVGDVDTKVATQQIKKIEEEIGRDLRVTLLSNKDYDFHRKKQSLFLLNILDSDKIHLFENINLTQKTNEIETKDTGETQI